MPTPTDSNVVQYLYECKSVELKADATIEAYGNALGIFIDFLNSKGKHDILYTVKSDVVDFRNWAVANFARGSCIIYMAAVKGFFAWAEGEDLIEHAPTNSRIVLKGQDAALPWLPTPLEIYQFRMSKRPSLKCALAFELLLSSGLRKSELHQLRTEDIQVGEKPLDREFGLPSAFAGGCLRLHADMNQIKTGSNRVTYFSTLAAKMLGRYVAKYGIPMNSNCPLFPCRADKIYDWIYEQWLKVHPRRTAQPEAQQVTQRTSNLSDVDLEKYKELHPEFAADIRRRQQKANKARPVGRPRYGRRAEISNSMHPHTLRHIFSASMYYRAYSGERYSLERVRDYLSHSKRSDTTMEYLTNLDWIKDDATWERLLAGKPTDWMMQR